MYIYIYIHIYRPRMQKSHSCQEYGPNMGREVHVTTHKNKDHFSVVVQIKKFLLTVSKNMIISVFVSTDDVLKVD